MCHPCLFIVSVVKPVLSGHLSFKTSWLFCLPDVNWWQAFTAICVAGKCYSDTEFFFFLASHLP